jgi:ATP-binding cassette subfamily B multidrug efflux pump
MTKACRPRRFARLLRALLPTVWPFLALLMAIGLAVSLIEASILRFVGALVDTLRSTSPDRLLPDHGREFLVMALVIFVGRPLANLTHDLLTQQAIAPGMTNLIQWQTHRYVLRQSVAYFERQTGQARE